MDDARISLCFIVNNLDCGGLEKVVISLANTLDASRYKIFLICLNGKGVLFPQLCLPEANILVLRKTTRFNFHFFREISVFFQKNNIQIAHAHNIAPLIFSGIAAKISRPQPLVIFTEHNQIFRLSSFGKWKFKHIYLNLAQHIVTCSCQLKKYYEQHLGTRRKINVIHNGIDGSKFHNLNKQEYKDLFKIPKNKFIIGTAVVISEQKGIKYLVKAAASVCKLRDDIHFVIAGDGPLKNDIQKRIDDNKLERKITLIGYCNEVQKFIATLDLYVLPSLWEGLPLALLEAMAAGKPIVATSVGGNQEIVEENVNGKIVPPRNEKALAEAILDLYDKKNEDFQKISANNFNKFNRLFSLNSMVENYSRFYLSTLSKS